MGLFGKSKDHEVQEEQVEEEEEEPDIEVICPHCSEKITETEIGSLDIKGVDYCTGVAVCPKCKKILGIGEFE